ncbi:MAG: hypothetical protein H8E10_12470 [Desulfobacterales bacterium]|jgi:hypothetical protein|nr:hypothetical protein [Desulfobacterales bacterium]MBL7172578.1 hypothetical protein [Desulfobacteraceae bacterium]
MNSIKMIFRKPALILLLLTTVGMASCSTSESSKWRVKNYDNRPPSWENDIGRPGGYGGEDPWS